MSAKRMIVDRRVWRAFEPLLAAAVADLRVGDPGDPATDVGPLLPGPGRDRALASLAAARTAGGRVVVGGDLQGGVIRPTVVLLPRAALGALALWRTETFAPVRGLVVCDGAADALGLVNDTPYGLGAAVFGGTEADRDLLVGGIRAARVLLDEGPLYQDPHLVVGGVGDSGLSGARPKLEQLVYARRVHRAAGT
jgi:acyl-CoA reductase-like NAD-dependent aldehyde dehydrogenase